MCLLAVSAMVLGVCTRAEGAYARGLDVDFHLIVGSNRLALPS